MWLPCPQVRGHMDAHWRAHWDLGADPMKGNGENNAWHNMER